MSAMTGIKAYRRPDGRVGIRNYVLVISMVSCSNTVAERIARATGTIPIVHEQGCCEFEHDHARTKLALVSRGATPTSAQYCLSAWGANRRTSRMSASA
jgi:altronate dehydratase